MTKWYFFMACFAMSANVPAIANDYYSVDFRNVKNGDSITIISPNHKGEKFSTRYSLAKTKRLTQLHADATLCYHSNQTKPLTIVRKLDGLAKRGDELHVNANKCVQLGKVRANLSGSIRGMVDSILKTIKDPNLSTISAYTRIRSESDGQNNLLFDAKVTKHCGIYPDQYLEPRYYTVLSIPYSSNHEGQEVLLASDPEGKYILAKAILHPNRIDFHDVDLSNYSILYVVTKETNFNIFLTLTFENIKDLRTVRSDIFSLPKEWNYEHVWENEIAYDLAILSGEFDDHNIKSKQANKMIAYALNDISSMLSHVDDTEHREQLHQFVHEYYHHRCTKVNDK